jgi:hypothetical protein
VLIGISLLVAVVLLKPEIFEQLKLFELGNLKFELRERVQKVEQAVSAQDKRIDQIIQTAMSPPIFCHLCGLGCVTEYLYHDDPLVRREWYYLKDHGFIQAKPGYERQEFNSEIHQKNSVEMFQPTEAGWSVIKLRRDEIPNFVSDGTHPLNVGTIPREVITSLDARRLARK